MGIFNFFTKKQQKKSPNFEIKQIIFNELSKQVLSLEQQNLKPVLEFFSTISFLGGGTAIALQLGHRKSIDYDFFSDSTLYSYFEFEEIIKSFGLKIDSESREQYRGIETLKQDEIHVKISGVNFTLCNFYRTLYDDQKINIVGNTYILNGLKIANLEELACMKLYAMITRNKWKDAVDLYFILKNTTYSLKYLFDKSEKYFSGIFRKDIVIENILAGDWNKTEKVDYLIDDFPKDDEVIDFLKKEVLKTI